METRKSSVRETLTNVFQTFAHGAKQCTTKTESAGTLQAYAFWRKNPPLAVGGALHVKCQDSRFTVTNPGIKPVETSVKILILQNS